MFRDHATDALLDTYETERRPAGERNVNWALFTFSNRSRASFAALLAETPDGDARRCRFWEVMKLDSTEYLANDLEIGVRYASEALVPDGTPPLALEPTGRN